MNIQEIHYLNKQGTLDIPLNDFLKEQRKYNTKSSKKNIKQKRYLYDNYEGIVESNGTKKCYKKMLKNYKVENERLIIDWLVEDIEWPNGIEWQKEEEYICEEYITNVSYVRFITIIGGIRRILIQNKL